MAVPEQTPYIEHTGNGATTGFSLGFQCESKDHLIVLVDEIEPPIETWSLIDENVVFTAAPTSGQKITLQRNTPFSRTTDYQSYNNSFRPPVINNDFDRVWWKIQELGVRDWLLDLKIQKFRDDVNLTALENTLEEAKQIRDDTADSVAEVQSNVAQSQSLLTDTTNQSNLAQGYASSANSANAAAQQAAIDVSTAESNVYSALSAQQVAVNNSLTAIAGGHKAYTTLALAQAAQASLPVNTIVEVTNDSTTSNNGTYQWNGTTLTKSAYDPLTQAKADATTKANAAEANAKSYADTRSEEAKAEIRAESLNTDTNLEMAVDKNDNAYRLVNSDGEEFLAGMDKSVQESFKYRQNGIDVTSQVGDIEQVLDADENIVQRTDYRGAFYISAGRAPVQHYTRQALSDSSVKSDFNAPLKTSHEKYAAPVKTAVLDLQSQCLPFIEPPLLLVQNTVNIPETILSNIQVADDNPVVRLPFPNAIGGSVHPYALQLRKPLYGYNNLLLDTNHLYGGEGDENPVMFGTNDWVNFDLVPDVKQPMRIPSTGKEGRQRDSFLSDSWFHYDPLDGALVWGVREVMRNAEEPGTRLHTTKTYDGIHWSAQQQLNIPNPVGGTFAAPAVLYNFDDNLFHMWASPSRGLLNHYTSLNGIDWIAAGQTNFNSEHGFAIWHQEVKYLGGKYFICADSQGAAANVRVGFSTDGVTWNMSPDIVTNPRPGVYKPSFKLDFDGENKVKFTFMWAHWAFGTAGNNTPANPMELYIQPTGWIDLTTI